VEKKRLISPNQADFRRGMRTLDKYVLNHLAINRQIIIMKGGKIVALFMDLKATFDSMDMMKLIDVLREKGVREELIERVEKILRETRSRVKRRRIRKEDFWTARGVRQGCSLSPHFI